MTSQNPHVHRLLLSLASLGLPEHKIRVIAPEVGGGFGSKIHHYPDEAIAAWCAIKVNRPVKWTATRSETNLTDTHGRDHWTFAELALSAEGKILGLRVKTHAVDGRLPVDLRALGADLPLRHLDVGPIRHSGDFRALDRRFHPHHPGRRLPRRRPPGSDLRGRAADGPRRPRARPRPGRDPPPQLHRARRLSLPDPGGAAIRQRQLRAGARAGARHRRLRRLARRAAEPPGQGGGKLLGIGVSSFIEACGLAPSQVVGSLGAQAGLWESAKVRVHPTGTVSVYSGSSSHGQGHKTAFAQIVSDRLGIPYDNIEVFQGDTQEVPFGMGTYGSRSAAVGGSAIVAAVNKVIAKGKKIAAALLEASEEEVVFEDNQFFVKGVPARSKAWGEVVLEAYLAHKMPDTLEPGLEETAFYNPSNFTYPFGTHIAVVEIDPETGAVALLRYVCVDDVGNVINPMIVDGQVHGGLAQGIGQALWEEAVYDDDGQLLTATMMDYALPRAHKLPNFETGRTVTPARTTRWGSRAWAKPGRSRRRRRWPTR